VVAAVVLALAIGVTAFTLLLSHRLSASATSLARAQAQAAVSSLDVRGGRLSAHEAPDQGASPGQVWVFADKRQVEAPNASRVVAAAARALAGGPERTETVEEQTRLYALPVVDNGRRFGTVVSAVALDPYEDTERTAFVGALILAALLLAAVAVLSRWMLGRALEPVSRMTADAAAWRASDLDRRFALGEPYDELTRLAATLDDLLEQIAASLRHEQRFTAELSHELRTPLARISAETELMLRRERTPDEYRDALDSIQRSADTSSRPRSARRARTALSSTSGCRSPMNQSAWPSMASLPSACFSPSWITRPATATSSTSALYGATLLPRSQSTTTGRALPATSAT
jgi:signal transduction histidine kinase